MIVLVRERTLRGGVREWWAVADRDVYYRRRRDAVRRGRGVTGMALAARRAQSEEDAIEHDLRRVLGLV